MSRLGRWARARIRVVLPLAALAVAAFALTACGGSNAKDAAAAQSASNGASAAAPAAAASSGNQAASSGAAASASRIYVYADTVVGAKGMPAAEAPFRSCTEQSRFAPGEQLGWRIKVYDAGTGDQLKDADLASVQVKLGDGQVFDAKYAGHGKPQPTDYFWAYFWVIPNDYPTGLLPYTITATTKDGRTATFTNETINIDSSKLTIQQKS